MLPTSFLQRVFLGRGPLKHHLEAKGYLGFIVKFNIIWQPNAAKDFSCNLILTIFLEMTPCCLSLSSRESLREEDHLIIIYHITGVDSHVGVNPCHLVQSLHPTSQNSFIFGFYYPFSDIRHCVNLFCSILIRLEMRAI